MNEFFIGESDFKVWLPSVSFEKAKDLPEDAFNSRRINGVMSTERTDRQGESVIAKGLDFSDFLNHGHYNDNHSQETSAIVGFPEKVSYHKDLSEFGCKAEGWSCEGYVLKGTKRSDALWELAKALETVPNRKLGFSPYGRGSGGSVNWRPSGLPAEGNLTLFALYLRRWVGERCGRFGASC